MTTPDEPTPELTAEAMGKAPGRGRLVSRRTLVVSAGSSRFQGGVILLGTDKRLHVLRPERMLR